MSARAHVTFPLFFFIVLTFIIPNAVYADKLLVSTNRLSYGLGATVKLTGRLTLKGYPVTDGLVSVQVEDASGQLKFIRVVSTGTAPQPWKVKVVEFYSCDSQGNPKDSFSRGALAYFKVTVESLDSILERQVTIAFNLLDSVGVSVAVTYVTVPLAPGKQISYFTSMPIPYDAFAGTATACVNVLTKWPKQGGYPYCSEESVELEITGGTPPGLSPAPPTGSDGYYSLSFKLPSNAKLGNYDVFASARYNAWARSTFDYFWLYTDINRDGEVNILDVAACAVAFGTRIGDPNFYRLADVNEDNVINILDIAGTAVDYGTARI